MSQFSYLTLFVFGYFALINLITVSLFGFDKMRAGGVKRRIPEKTLLLCVLLGGTPAGLIGMKLFRHKTKKISFQFPMYLIMLIQIILIAWLIHEYSIFATDIL